MFAHALCSGSPHVCLQNRIANIRSHIYYNLNCELAPALQSMLDTPWEAAAFEPARLASRLPPPADTAKLIAVRLCIVAMPGHAQCCLSIASA